ncbi:heavy-metal-associated domain-containing protein [Nocardioides sp.]|uniref:heavy-metal-associated domain-containing protein n=1 Tax=Nocardioides sp. TaxID=35761 RepID=UPI0035650A3B
MTDLELIVAGMSCRHCVREVTARLRDVPGVRTVVASARTSRVRLGGTMSAADVRAALAGTSYTVQLVSDPTTLP